MEWITVILLLAVVCEIYADYCGENTFCHSPYKCCETKRSCCYDSMLYSSKHIHPQIWNMWYFWFLVIFIMMSCFGGCGYYRRRRLAVLTRMSDNMAPVRPVPERNSDRGTEESTNRFTYFAYNGPGLSLTEPDANLPPPYAEVVSQPQLYPVNKMELPPYPGYDKQDDQNELAPHESTTLAHEAPLPPPYSECSYDPALLLVPDNIPSQCLPSQSADVELPAAVPSRVTDDSKAS